MIKSVGQNDPKGSSKTVLERIEPQKWTG